MKKSKIKFVALITLALSAMMATNSIASTFATEVAKITNAAILVSENDVALGIMTNTVSTSIVKDKVSGGGGGHGYIRPSVATTENTSETTTDVESIENTSELTTAVTEQISEITTSLANDKPFDDLNNHWAEEFINYLYAQGIVGGVGNRMFAPDAPTKRGDFAVVLDKMLNLTNITGISVFRDVNSESYYTQAINNSFAAGYFLGYGNGEFKPESNITREELMVIVAKLYNTKTSSNYDFNNNDGDYSALNKYADNGAISWWAKPYIAYLTTNNIVMGDDSNYIHPTDDITRAEMATIIYNYLNK